MMTLQTEPRSRNQFIHLGEVASGRTFNSRVSNKTDLRFGGGGSFSIDIEAQVFFDHRAGEGGGVLDLQRLAGVDPSEAMTAPKQSVRSEGFDEKQQAKIAKARAFVSQHIREIEAHSPIEAYLISRGIESFHSPHLGQASWFLPQGVDPLPAMLGAASNVSGDVTGYHLTRLNWRGDQVRVEKVKTMHGVLKGSAVWLGERVPGSTLIVGEGIESTLSAYLLLGIKGAIPVAALSTSGMKSFVVPPGFNRVVIAADNDANKAGQQAARELASRLLASSISVEIKAPRKVGSDFNDELLEVDRRDRS